MAIDDASAARVRSRNGAWRERCIERVDGDQFGWKPHEKSMSLGRLATHVAEIPQWGHTILNEPEFNMVDGEYKPTATATTAEVLALFDAAGRRRSRAILAAKSDAELMSTWTFKQNGKELFAHAARRRRGGRGS